MNAEDARNMSKVGMGKRPNIIVFEQWVRQIAEDGGYRGNFSHYLSGDELAYLMEKGFKISEIDSEIGYVWAVDWS